MKCTGERCPMQVGYDVANCQCEGCSYRTAPTTNYDRIRNMSVEELAEFICGIYDYEYDSPVYNEVESGKHICGDFIPDFDEDKIKQWLESEVDTE